MHHTAIRTVALFEAAKGALVLLAGWRLFAFVHRDVQAMAERLLLHAHLNPASRYPRIFLDLAARADSHALRLLAAAALAYALVRFVEAYALWRGLRWGAWFAAASGAVYIPFELAGLARHPGWLGVAALAVNVAVVGVMARQLRAGYRAAGPLA